MPPDTPHDLGTFLRSHRERLRAVDVGLRDSREGRRRTPGLRREEVAQLCGMSPTWYTWIEQGRDISVSPAALARLAEALRMSRAERAYLFELTRKQDPAIAAPVGPMAIPPVLQQILASTPHPAYCLDGLWQACAWNAPALHLFAGWLGGADLSLLRYVFLDPTARGFIVDWDERARRLVAEFRADTSRRAADPAVAALATQMQRDSAAFAGFWKANDVLGREGGLRRFNHPEAGPVHYEQMTLHPAGYDDLKLVMLVPAKG
ncbi:helix-turn-helix transcriptional regulator [Lichenifustis flavocetrariae]|uniref:Helix-turn-helix transcriptional regulator n=1 Tax=Lichenifustis flavocetrariae TaxID=2949735 RepID=A0AA42CPG0_9HYPH|nr:helix-turn-helix transcriptional regulator [Lichenifustis flavocetrariae]MCW6510355.1 helix-turn-helix transcriptional regulator [Lichenifustis flavocetrariae]